MFRVTRRYQFSASHRLHSDSLSEEENYRIYGKCNNPYGHGHNYILHVSARGPVSSAGFAVHIRSLDELVSQQVLVPFDRRNLNIDVAWAKPVVPTSEVLAIEICRRLKQHWGKMFEGQWPKLEKVRIEETPRNIFEVSADEIE